MRPVPGHPHLQVLLLLASPGLSLVLCSTEPLSCVSISLSLCLDPQPEASPRTSNMRANAATTLNSSKLGGISHLSPLGGAGSLDHSAAYTVWLWANDWAQVLVSHLACMRVGAGHLTEPRPRHTCCSSCWLPSGLGPRRQQPQGGDGPQGPSLQLHGGDTEVAQLPVVRALSGLPEEPRGTDRREASLPSPPRRTSTRTANTS